jgi:parallel beta-helix repeat protein
MWIVVENMLRNKAYREYYFRIVVEIIVLAIFLLPSVGMVRAETATPNNLQETQLQDALQMLGRLEANGTHFELKNSSYLNITLDSSEPINLTIESPPEMVIMRLESISSATTTKIIMRGFDLQTTYQKYEDDYHNLVTFTTDDSGSYAYTQDLSKPHYVFIQPVPSKASKTSILAISAANTLPSTIFIRDDATGGNCTLIGTWDNSTKTCTLTTNLAETVQIDNDGITLNGNGHMIMGSGTGSGVYLLGRSGVTIKSLTVKNFTDGIYYNNYPPNSSFGNTLIDNIANSNYRNGIYFSYSGGRNDLTNNTANFNLGSGIVLEEGSYNSTLLYNNASYNKDTGIYLYHSSNNMLIGNSASNNVYEGVLSYQASSNTLKNNILNSNRNGIFFRSSFRSIFINNIANSNYGDGIFIYYYSSENNLTNNTANFNLGDGIVLGYVDSNNTLLGNSVSNNNNRGIYVAYSGNNNTVTGNNASNNYNGISLNYSRNVTVVGNTASNNYYGIHLYSSSNNTIYNNIFNNTNNFIESISINRWNITKTSAINIIDGPYFGGNFWANPSGTGFSQTCSDSDHDGICDLPYILDSNNIDYLPLTTQVGGVIHGATYNDANRNNMRDAGEQGLANWTIQLKGFDTLKLTSITRTAITDVNGNYSFTNLNPGTYVVYEKLPSKWIPSTSPARSISLGKGETAVVDFGNWRI